MQIHYVINDEARWDWKPDFGVDCSDFLYLVGTAKLTLLDRLS